MVTSVTSIIKKSFSSFCTFFWLYAKVFFVLLAIKSIIFYSLYFFGCFDHIVALSSLDGNSVQTVMEMSNAYMFLLISYVFYMLFYQAILISKNRLQPSENIATLISRSASIIFTFRFFIRTILLVFAGSLIIIIGMTPILLIGIFSGVPFSEFSPIMAVTTCALAGIMIAFVFTLSLRCYLVLYLLIETMLSPLQLIKESVLKTKGHLFLIIKTIGLFIPVKILMAFVFATLMTFVSAILISAVPHHPWMICVQCIIIGQTMQDVFITGFSTLVIAYTSEAIMLSDN